MTAPGRSCKTDASSPPTLFPIFAQTHTRMIKSMTGYGKASAEWSNKKIVVEVKSLNSKGLDASVKSSSLYREKELEIRGLLTEKVVRGKVDLVIYAESDADSTPTRVDEKLALKYYEQLRSLAESFGQKDVDYLGTVVRLPDVLSSEKPELEDAEWQVAGMVLHEALDALNASRNREGGHLEVDLRQRVDNIVQLQKEVEGQAGERLRSIKNRFSQALTELSSPDKLDQNRYEQELIYYMEKLDITEELVRLQNHCNYFLETLDEPPGQGKKLGFIGQEMGREINTLGSKANHAGIQRLVVQMKDELEKIKEQVLNIM